MVWNKSKFGRFGNRHLGVLSEGPCRSNHRNDGKLLNIDGAIGTVTNEHRCILPKLDLGADLGHLGNLIGQTPRNGFFQHCFHFF
jgi:hypothetical protein